VSFRIVACIARDRKRSEGCCGECTRDRSTSSTADSVAFFEACIFAPKTILHANSGVVDEIQSLCKAVPDDSEVAADRSVPPMIAIRRLSSIRPADGDETD
jgi:hypothetical protein